MDKDGNDIEARLLAVEDRLALLDLEGAYGPAYDARAGDAWAALFTEDGAYEGRQLAGMPLGNRIKGRANLARFCQEQPSSGVHTMHAPHLRLDGDRATGRVHFQFQSVAVDEHSRTHVRQSMGYYDVAYARTAQGWRMQRRITTLFEVVQRTTFGYEATAADPWAPADASAEDDYRDRRS
ncbi:MAG: hypothetical protein NVSMB13_03350 [Mycobacteriales bacterium]